MPDESESHAARVRRIATDISKTDPNYVCNRPVLGQRKFTDRVAEVEYVISLAKVVAGIALDDMPEFLIADLEGALAVCNSLLEPFLQFDPSAVNNPQEEASSRRNQFDRLLQQQRESIQARIAFAVAYSTAISAIGQKAESRIADAMKRAEEELAKIKRLGDQVKELAASQATGEHVGVFEAAAKKYRCWANSWLVATLLFVLLGAAVTYLAFVKNAAQAATTAPSGFGAPTIQIIVSRVIIVSLTYFLAIWAARNYRSYAHLASVSEHRVNALRTLRIFAELANEDKALKDAVFLETVHCIFGPSVTGFLGPEENISNPIADLATLLSRKG
jgi:hypothetical protein